MSHAKRDYARKIALQHRIENRVVVVAHLHQLISKGLSTRAAIHEFQTGNLPAHVQTAYDIAAQKRGKQPDERTLRRWYDAIHTKPQAPEPTLEARRTIAAYLHKAGSLNNLPDEVQLALELIGVRNPSLSTLQRWYAEFYPTT